MRAYMQLGALAPFEPVGLKVAIIIGMLRGREFPGAHLWIRNRLGWEAKDDALVVRSRVLRQVGVVAKCEHRRAAIFVEHQGSVGLQGDVAGGHAAGPSEVSQAIYRWGRPGLAPAGITGPTALHQWLRVQDFAVT